MCHWRNFTQNYHESIRKYAPVNLQWVCTLGYPKNYTHSFTTYYLHRILQLSSRGIPNDSSVHIHTAAFRQLANSEPRDRQNAHRFATLRASTIAIASEIGGSGPDRI